MDDRIRRNTYLSGRNVSSPQLMPYINAHHVNIDIHRMYAAMCSELVSSNRRTARWYVVMSLRDRCMP